MKPTILTLCLHGCCTFVFSQTNNTLSNFPPDKHVELHVSGVSFLSYNEREQGDDGQFHMGPPSKRVLFGDKESKENAIQAKVGDKEISCPLLYQDVAYFITNNKRGGRVGVSWYASCPFELVKPLSVDTNLEMRIENTIEIESADNNLLYVAKESAVPIVVQNGRVFTGCEAFRNMVWRFRNAGIDFRAGHERYHVSKPGATIRFRSTGLEVSGVERIKE